MLSFGQFVFDEPGFGILGPFEPGPSLGWEAAQETSGRSFGRRKCPHEGNMEPREGGVTPLDRWPRSVQKISQG